VKIGNEGISCVANDAYATFWLVASSPQAKIWSAGPRDEQSESPSSEELRHRRRRSQGGLHVGLADFYKFTEYAANTDNPVVTDLNEQYQRKL